MEYSYYRDLKHNYLVVERDSKDEKENGGTYQQKILESGRVEGLLPCNIRNINGKKYFYYEINTMQSVKDRFLSHGMKYDQLKKLFLDMKNMMESLSEFLLGEEGVVFNIDNIFSDLSKDDYKFMYYPFAGEKGSFAELTEQLLEMVDPEDAKANEVIYSLCDHAQTKGAITIAAIDTYFKDDEEVIEHIPEKEIRVDYFVDDDIDEDDFEEKETNLEKSNKKLGGRVQILMSLLFFGLIAGVMYIRMTYILTNIENILSIGVMGVSAVTGVISLITGVRDFSGKKEKRTTKVTAQLEDEDYFEDEADYGYYESKDPYKTPIRVTGNTTEKKKELSETTVLNIEDEFDNNITLYSRNLSKTIRIELDKLPLTIGKMEECVDRVLEDSSISRIHCRFVSDEGRLALIDLNSTNGTYRNGLKLKAQEKTYIDSGDEIRIGRICFDCR
ncbi:DUF6382 domain-containing protein [Butyrivibrio proteoclasticus]|uniref:DUF6382 domain-containing protein n=1 Tax=Butyrivibrio proteoclasticus TaxID=43305 RepID=UPI00047B1713|nr:DUF6382 domain-containing protein [Butyrivibrio proteoclasticus]